MPRGWLAGRIMIDLKVTGRGCLPAPDPFPFVDLSPLSLPHAVAAPGR